MFEQFKNAAVALGCTVTSEQPDTGLFRILVVCPNKRMLENYVAPDKDAFSLVHLKNMLGLILEGGLA